MRDGTSFNLQAHLQTMRILVFALVTGLATFTGVSLFIVQDPPRDELFMLSLIAPAFFVLEAGLSFFVPALMEKQLPQALAKQGKTSPTPMDLAMFFQTKLIVSSALLEGAGFLGVIAYIIEHRPMVLAVPALAIAMLALKFPSADQVETYIDRKQREFEEMRNRGDYA